MIPWHICSALVAHHFLIKVQVALNSGHRSTKSNVMQTPHASDRVSSTSMFLVWVSSCLDMPRIHQQITKVIRCPDHLNWLHHKRSVHLLRALCLRRTPSTQQRKPAIPTRDLFFQSSWPQGRVGTLTDLRSFIFRHSSIFNKTVQQHCWSYYDCSASLMVYLTPCHDQDPERTLSPGTTTCSQPKGDTTSFSEYHGLRWGGADSHPTHFTFGYKTLSSH